MLSLCHQKLSLPDKKHSRNLSNQNIEWMRCNSFILASLLWWNSWLVWKSTQKLKKQSVKYVCDFPPKKRKTKKAENKTRQNATAYINNIELFNDHKYSYLESQTLWFSLQIRHQFPSNQRLWNEIRIWNRQFFNESTMFRFGRSKRSHR